MESISYKDRQLLITGGTGLVGSYLLRYLVRQGYTRIRALYRPGSRFDLVADIRSKIEWVESDLLDVIGLESALEHVEGVYHCAALISYVARDRKRMLSTNRDGTANLINLCLATGVKKLVHVSSIAAIGRDRRKPHVNESNKWQRSPDNTYYAISKFQAEQEVWRGQAEGLTVAVVNPSVILGGGFWDRGPQKIFPLVWRQFPFYPTGSTGFVDVRDVARFLILLMESDQHGERYILNSDNIPYRELQRRIAEALGRKPPSIALPSGLARWGAYLEGLRSWFTGSEPLLNRESARLTGSSYYYDNQKSREAFDFHYLPLERTITETAELFLSAAQNGFAPRVLPLV